MINKISYLLKSATQKINFVVPHWVKKVIAFFAILLTAAFIICKPIKSLIQKVTEKKAKENYIKEMMTALNYARQLLDETKNIDGKLQVKKCIRSILNKCDLRDASCRAPLRDSCKSFLYSVLDEYNDIESDDNGNGTVEASETLNTVVVKFIQLLTNITAHERSYKNYGSGHIADLLLKNKTTKSGVEINVNEIKLLHIYAIFFEPQDNMPPVIKVKP